MRGGLAWVPDEAAGGRWCGSRSGGVQALLAVARVPVVHISTRPVGCAEGISTPTISCRSPGGRAFSLCRRMTCIRVLASRMCEHASVLILGDAAYCCMMSYVMSIVNASVPLPTVLAKRSV